MRGQYDFNLADREVMFLMIIAISFLFIQGLLWFIPNVLFA